jgi:hypothetical protein
MIQGVERRCQLTQFHESGSPCLISVRQHSDPASENHIPENDSGEKIKNVSGWQIIKKIVKFRGILRRYFPDWIVLRSDNHESQLVILISRQIIASLIHDVESL